MPDTHHAELDPLDPAEIADALAGTPFAGGLHHFPTIDSTNTHAIAQARHGAPHGSFYLADEQTAGRGRSGHAWHSQSGLGLYLSVLLRPGPEDSAQSWLPWLPLLAGLAAHRAIREVAALDVDLRWPNDLLIGPRKAGGILVESAAGAAVAGIGVNLHQRGFPTNLATEATSLDLETGRCTSRQQLLVAFLRTLHRELSGFSSGAEIPTRIAAISTWIHGRRVQVHGPQACTGSTDGLDEHGFLRVRTANGLVTVTTGGIRAALD